MFGNKIIKMSAQTQRVVSDAIALIEQRLWEGVAVENIKRLALHSSRLQGMQALQSHISNELPNRSNKTVFAFDEDPKAIPLDTHAIGLTQVEVDHDRASKVDKHSSFGNTSMKARTRKFTSESFFSKKETQHRKTDYNPQKIQIVALPQTKDEHEVIDPEEDKMRVYMLKSQKYDAEMREMGIKKSKQKLDNDELNKKMFKDVKKFTFDYAGKFFTVGNLDLAGQKPIKLNRNDGKQSVLKKQMKSPQNSTIQNDKLKDKNAKKGLKSEKNVPCFDDNRPQSLLDLMKEENDISEGVKITASKGNENLVKQRKRKLRSGLKKYRLSQFQQIPKEQKFKQFRSKALNSISSKIMDVNKTAPLPLEQKSQYTQKSIGSKNRKNTEQAKKINSQSEQILKVNKEKLHPYMALPPLKHNLLTRNRASYSNRTIDISYSNSRVTNKSKIKIDDEELFQANFMNVLDSK